jgi:hypothetical protein
MKNMGTVKKRVDGIIRTDTMMDTSHDTVVIGWRKSDNKIVFLRSYEYSKQEVEAQADLKAVIDAGHTWQIAHIQTLNLATEEV